MFGNTNDGFVFFVFSFLTFQFSSLFLQHFVGFEFHFGARTHIIVQFCDSGTKPATSHLPPGVIHQAVLSAAI